MATCRPLPGALLAAIVAAPAAARGPERADAKRGFTLLAPTPPDLMRELSTDRPDATESPYTVDAGHVQVELSFAEFTRESTGAREWSVAPVNLKLGLLNDLDVQFVLPSWMSREEGDEPSADGFGDAQLRLKHNLWGNDGGPTAMAVMPFVSAPTGAREFSRGRVEGGLILPFAAELPAGLGLGLMAELDAVYDRDAREYQIDFVHTATAGREIAGPVSGFVEYVGAENLSTGRGYRGTVQFGFTLRSGPNVQWDAGVGLGVTRAADDLVVFAGVSLRY